MTNALRSTAVSRRQRVTRFVTRAAVTTALVAAAAAIGMWVSAGRPHRRGRRGGVRVRWRVPRPRAGPRARHAQSGSRRAAGRPQGVHHAVDQLDVRRPGRRRGRPARVRRRQRRRLRRQRARRRGQHHRRPADARSATSGRGAPARPRATARSSTSPPARSCPTRPSLRPGRDGDAHRAAVHADRSGAADVVIDVFGWFSSSGYVSNGGSYGARLIPTTPAPAASSTRATLGTAARRRRPASRSRSGAPTPPTRRSPTSCPNSSNVVGVMLNITAVNNLPGSASTFFSLTPYADAGGPSQPPAT